MHASVLARATARSNLQCMDCLTRNNNVFFVFAYIILVCNRHAFPSGFPFIRE